MNLMLFGGNVNGDTIEVSFLYLKISCILSSFKQREHLISVQ